jgi:hypothetical protein
MLLKMQVPDPAVIFGPPPFARSGKFFAVSGILKIVSSF